jgi:DNA-binding CsgD family transcriptional regulator
VKPRTAQVQHRSNLGADQRRRHRAAAYWALILINAACEVKSTFIESQRGYDGMSFVCEGGTRLLPELQAAVVPLLKNLARDPGTGDLLVLLDDDRTIRLSPLSSGGEQMFAVVIESDRNEDCITRAASRYRLTIRQVEVLLLILEGAGASDVARILQISEYTAQGYLKTLLVKTSARNRAEMVAKVFDWPSARATSQEEIKPSRRLA